MRPESLSWDLQKGVRGGEIGGVRRLTWDTGDGGAFRGFENAFGRDEKRFLGLFGDSLRLFGLSKPITHAIKKHAPLHTSYYGFSDIKKNEKKNDLRVSCGLIPNKVINTKKNT